MKKNHDDRSRRLARNHEIEGWIDTSTKYRTLHLNLRFRFAWSTKAADQVLYYTIIT